MGINVGEWGGGGEFRVGLDFDWAVSNAEMLQVLEMISQKKMYRLQSIIINYNGF